MSQLLKLALQATNSPADGYWVSWEGIVAVCALLAAIGGLLAVVWRGGQLVNQLETAREEQGKLAAALAAARQEWKEDLKPFIGKLDGLTRMVFELRGAQKRGSNDD